jgi:hypothetical protein
MQSSLPVELRDRNIKAVDIVDSAEIAKIVAIRVGGVLACFDPQWPDFEMVMCITQPMNGTERLMMSLRPIVHEGMIPP